MVPPAVVAHSPLVGAVAPWAQARAAPREPSLNAEEASVEPPGTGFLSGHVVDGAGYPVSGAVLHVHGPSGTRAERIADDGEFHFQVREGTWTVEAGWFDGDDEWRSIPATVRLTPGATATIALEILMGGAGHTVRSGLRETFGVGWEVVADDGPLRAGDVLVEVGGRLLTDLQPEAARAALRERPGESLSATVLRAGASGALEEVEVVLQAR
ncbi:MAG: hypothetical protein KTR31_30130 [Myxococcales bacterium]|nr:hypothetical protein [Myxococcales bacterium]